MNIIQTSGKRLSKDNNYERPNKTITESIQNKKSIEEQLTNFEEIPNDELCYVNLNTQLKYLTYDKKSKKELFRFGGLLVKVAKEYVVLAGKDGMRFSVQRYTINDKGDIIHTTRFFRKIKDTVLLQKKINDIEEEKKETILKQQELIEKQKLEILSMKKKLGIKK
jgi:hypothetical protein